MRAKEDQNKINEFITQMQQPNFVGDRFYINFEAFEPRLLADSYGISLDKTFEELLIADNAKTLDLMNDDAFKGIPDLPDDYFENIEQHLRPSEIASAQQRYDAAVKLLIRDCAQQSIRARAKITPSQQTGAFYLFLQSEGMADLYKHFGHDSILFMDSGYWVNRNAFPITFISVLDNFMKGRIVGVLISQFADTHTYSKCLSEFKRSDLQNIRPLCSMTDFDTAEVSAFKNTWSDIVVLICTFHAITAQNKWIDRNVLKSHREKLKSMCKELHYAKNEMDLKKKLANLKRYCTRKGLHNVKQYLQKN